MTAPKTTVKLLERYIRDEGRGIGHGEAYKAFIQLRRWNASPVSVQTFGSLPPFKRDMHFLCRSEWLLGVLFAWAGFHVREQFPMWPWPHPGPLYGLPDMPPEVAIAWSRGTLQLCRQAGIEHGTYVGTDIPYIWTLDLVLTPGWLPPEAAHCAIVSVKPLADEKYSGDIDPIARGPEKLEIERRFAREVGASWYVGDRTLYPGPILGQLDFYISFASPPPVERMRSSLDALIEMEAVLAAEPPMEWRRRIEMDYGFSWVEATYLANHLIWHQYIDVDVSRVVKDDVVCRPGGRQLRSAIREFLTKVK